MTTMQRILPPAKTSPSSEDARLRKGEQTRELILEAAARLLSKSSVRGMAISELVKETGIPASSIYWHFGSKEGLVCTVIETGARRLLEQLPGPSDGPGNTSIEHALMLISEVLRKEFSFVRLLLKVGLEFSDEDDSEFIRIVRRAREETISYGVKSLVSVFPDMPPERAAAAASRILRQLMTFADGIVINISIEKDLTASMDILQNLPDYMLLLVERERAAGKKRK